MLERKECVREKRKMELENQSVARLLRTVNVWFTHLHSCIYYTLASKIAERSPQAQKPSAGATLVTTLQLPHTSG